MSMTPIEALVPGTRLRLRLLPLLPEYIVIIQGALNPIESQRYVVSVENRPDSHGIDITTVVDASRLQTAEILD